MARDLAVHGAVDEIGIDQVVAEDKEHNGKVEVFNANLAARSLSEPHGVPREIPDRG